MIAKRTFNAQVLVPGEGSGEALVLAEPLSLWGGLDPQTGTIIDQRHPNCGAQVNGRILILPAGRGSSSASSILLEAVRVDMAPIAIITSEVDSILALGAAVAREMYAQAPAVLVLRPDEYAQMQTGQRISIALTGTVTAVSP